MALALKDRVKETTIVVGTGSVTLLGSSIGFQPFSVVGNGNTTYYCISDQFGSNWEVGIGTYSSSGNTLARTTVLASSNGGALVVFTAGVKDVFVTYPSEKGVWYDTSGNVLFTGTTTATNLAYTGTLTGSTGILNIGSGQLYKDASGNVGIGLTSPTQKLQVAGSQLLSSPGSAVYTYFDGTSNSIGRKVTGELAITVAGSLPITFVTGTTETMRIDSSGNVGIGTSSPACALQITNAGVSYRGQLSIDGGVGGNAQITLYNGPTTGTANLTAQIQTNTDNVGVVIAASQTSGYLVFRTNAGSERMRIDSSGNVGIGTSSPTNISGNGDLTVLNRVFAGVANASYPSYSFIGRTDSGMWSPSASTIAFSTGFTERMRIDSSGNVGIGTSSPNGKLQVYGGRSHFYANNEPYAIGVGFVNGASSFFAGYIGCANTDIMTFSSSGGSERMRIDSSGNVGIGTSSPAAKLEVSGGTSAPIVILSATSGNPGSGVKLLGASGYKNWQVSSSLIAVAGALEFTPSTAAGGSTFTTPVMIIDSSGNVGIGTTAPNNKLTVGAPNGIVGGVCVASFSGVDVAASNTSGMVVITSTDSIAANIGGSIGFAANGTVAGYPTGSISGRRENATAGDYSSYMQFTTSASNGSVQEKMRIDSSGNVGIGTTSATSKLHVNGAGETAPPSTSGAKTATIYVTATQNSPNCGGAIEFGGQSTTTFAAWKGGLTDGTSNTLGYLAAYTRNATSNTSMTERLRIDENGNLLVGTTSTLFASSHDFVNSGSAVLGLRNSGATAGLYWQVGPDSNSSFKVYNASNVGVFLTNGSTAWASSSDERLKTDLIPIENGLEKVNSLRSVTGRFKTDEEGVSRSFLIAQDVQKVLPEAVSVQNDELGTLGVAYTEVIPLLVASIKELKAIIDTQQEQINSLLGK